MPVTGRAIHSASGVGASLKNLECRFVVTNKKGLRDELRGLSVLFDGVYCSLTADVLWVFSLQLFS